MFELRHYFTIVVFVLFSFSCGNKGSSGQCNAGVPTALFTEQMEMVREHQFMLNKEESNEMVIFENGLKLELLQSGCDQIKQVFQVTMVGDFSEQPDPFWINRTADMFAYFAKCDDSLTGFLAWQQAVQALAPQMRLAQTQELDGGKSIKVDRIIGNQNAILLVEIR